MSLRKQEEMIFGSAAGDKGTAGNLTVRLLGPRPRSGLMNADDLDAGVNTPLGYALFPLRPFGNNDGKRGTISAGGTFNLHLIWNGDQALHESLHSLIAVWGNLGSLGFRSRRSFGALQLQSPSMPLAQALANFSSSSGIAIKNLDTNNLADWRSTSSALLRWYRSWRQHGQMSRRWDRHNERWIAISANQQSENRSQPGFKYARRDHNEGLDVQGTRAPIHDAENPKGHTGQTFRPALGLPIIQLFSSLEGGNGRPLPRVHSTVNWDFSPNGGRFASPILLRPYKDTQGWQALVIFTDARQWQSGDQVFLNGTPRAVSLDLYNAMKNDPHLKPFP